MSTATDPQLQLLVDQLTRMYDALQSMRKGVALRNPALFRIMAEGPLDEIRQLQRAIDEYTGVAELREERIDFWIKVSGGDVAFESAPSSIVTAILDALRKGVQSVAEVMTRGELSTRPTKEIRDAADMRVVALAPGSLQIGLRIAGDGEVTEQPQGTAVVEQALRRVFDAAESVASEGDVPPDGDRATQLAVWNAVKALVPRDRGGIDLVELHGRLVSGSGPIRLTRDIHPRIDRQLEQLTTEQLETHRGVVREIDLDQNTFTLRASRRKSVRCAFPVELIEIAKEALDHVVEVSGTRRRHGSRDSGPLRLVRLTIVEAENV